MLLDLAQWLSKDIRFFSVFNYLTLRAVLATLTALMIGLVFGPRLIRKLTALKIGQAVRLMVLSRIWKRAVRQPWGVH